MPEVKSERSMLSLSDVMNGGDMRYELGWILKRSGELWQKRRCSSGNDSSCRCGWYEYIGRWGGWRG